MVGYTDLGKVLLHPSFGEEPQWSVVGETSFTCRPDFVPHIPFARAVESVKDCKNSVLSSSSDSKPEAV